MELQTDKAVEPEFVISRVFEASRELVWRACSEPEHMMRWWGPKGCAMRAASMDFRPGGIFHYCLRVVNGTDMWGKFVYRLIEPPLKIVFVNSFSDESAGVSRHPMVPSWPLELLTTFTLAWDQKKTTVTVKWSPLSPTARERETFEEATPLMQQGWTGTFDQLAAYLPGISGEAAVAPSMAVREVSFMRIIDAPRERVWKAWTEPEQVRQWWGPKYFTNPVCELDVRAGGAIRIDMQGPDGTVYPMTGIYKEATAPERLVFSSAALDKAGTPVLKVRNTVRFFPRGKKTEVALRASVSLATAAAAPYLDGMQQGWTQSLVRLAAYVA